jgi:hypothetical protein
VNLVEVKEVARLRVAARRADSTSSRLQAQLQDMEASLHQLRTQVSEYRAPAPGSRPSYRTWRPAFSSSGHRSVIYTEHQLQAPGPPTGHGGQPSPAQDTGQ